MDAPLEVGDIEATSHTDTSYLKFQIIPDPNHPLDASHFALRWPFEVEPFDVDVMSNSSLDSHHQYSFLIAATDSLNQTTHVPVTVSRNAPPVIGAGEVGASGYAMTFTVDASAPG